MEHQSRLRYLWVFLRTVALIDLVIFGAAALYCWVEGGFTPWDYGRVLTWGGLAALGIGGASLFGAQTHTHSFEQQYGESVADADVSSLARQSRRHTSGSYPFVAKMGGAGTVAVICGMLIQRVFG